MSLHVRAGEFTNMCAWGATVAQVRERHMLREREQSHGEGEGGDAMGGGPSSGLWVWQWPPPLPPRNPFLAMGWASTHIKIGSCVRTNATTRALKSWAPTPPAHIAAVFSLSAKYEW